MRRRRAAQLDRQIVDGYRRIPPATTDEWGSIDTAHALTATMLARSLDDEDGGW